MTIRIIEVATAEAEAESLLTALCEELARQGYGPHGIMVERNCCANVVVGTLYQGCDTPPHQSIACFELRDDDPEVDHPVLCTVHAEVSGELRRAITEHLAKLDVANGVTIKPITYVK